MYCGTPILPSSSITVLSKSPVLEGLSGLDTCTIYILNLNFLQKNEAPEYIQLQEIRTEHTWPVTNHANAYKIRIRMYHNRKQLQATLLCWHRKKKFKLLISVNSPFQMNLELERLLLKHHYVLLLTPDLIWFHICVLSY